MMFRPYGADGCQPSLMDIVITLGAITSTSQTSVKIEYLDSRFLSLCLSHEVHRTCKALGDFTPESQDQGPHQGVVFLLHCINLIMSIATTDRRLLCV